MISGLNGYLNKDFFHTVCVIPGGTGHLKYFDIVCSVTAQFQLQLFDFRKIENVSHSAGHLDRIIKILRDRACLKLRKNVNTCMYMSHVMRKPAFLQNKGADQLCGNCAADQPLCFSLYRLYNPSTFLIQNFKHKAIVCGCTAWLVFFPGQQSRRQVFS